MQRGLILLIFCLAPFSVQAAPVSHFDGLVTTLSESQRSDDIGVELYKLFNPYVPTWNSVNDNVCRDAEGEDRCPIPASLEKAVGHGLMPSSIAALLIAQSTEEGEDYVEPISYLIGPGHQNVSMTFWVAGLVFYPEMSVEIPFPTEASLWSVYDDDTNTTYFVARVHACGNVATWSIYHGEQLTEAAPEPEVVTLASLIVPPTGTTTRGNSHSGNSSTGGFYFGGGGGGHNPHDPTCFLCPQHLDPHDPYTPAVIPLPASLFMLMVGLAVLAGFSRYQKTA